MILISGAHGFTGRHLITMARARGYAVHALRADLMRLDDLRNEVAQVNPDFVVHLAGVSFVGHAEIDAFYRINVLGSLHLLDALASLDTKPQSILMASSANVYGNCAESPITETQSPAPVNHYAASKLVMEHMARTRLDDLPVFFTRPFNYTGVGQSSDFLIPKLVQHFVARSTVVELGNMDVEREFNDVRFVCDAYLRLLQRATPGEAYNLCTGRTYSLRKVLTMLTDLTRHPVKALVNKAFVRPNEISHLCGDSAKLLNCIGSVNHFELTDTLNWMLQEQKRANTPL